MPAVLSGQAHHAATARATANLDAIASRPANRIRAATGVPREIYEPERALRRRNAATRATPSPRASAPIPPAPGTVTPSFTGFQALADNFHATPPDTTGAIGPRHIMTMLNTQVLIQSRSGATRTNYPITLDAFWSPLIHSPDAFDPRVLYDPEADRWIASAAAKGSTPASALLIAVSKTGDPGGEWNYFKVSTGNANQWGDFPVLGFNSRWIAVSMNLLQIQRDSYINTTLFVFGKADLYKNGTGNFTSFIDDSGELTPVRDYDNDTPDTMYFVQAIATEFAATPNTGEIRISRLDGPLGAESFRGGGVGTIAILDPWSDSAPGEDDFGPQPGVSAKIETGDSRLVNCAQRKGAIWCAHTVFLPYATPLRAAVQWFQIDYRATPPAVIQRGRIEDPLNAHFYAYPSIAVNKNNDALVGYTRFSLDAFPSSALAFRTRNDPLNAMQPEIMVKSGEAPYVNLGARSGSNRWGDYSATMVDPVNDLTFWTIQEYAATPPANRTGAFGTWWTQIGAPSAGDPCAYTLAAATATVDSAGSSGSVAVTTGPGCPWQAVSDVPWIAITSAAAGNGAGTVEYAVAKAPDSANARSGSLIVAGLLFTVTQSPAAPSKPAFTAAGVMNAASFAAGPIAPGELITIKGSNLGPAALQAATTGDTVAGGARVLFDGKAAPVLYASAGQIAAISPYSLQGRSATQVQVEYQGAQSLPVTIPVVETAPAIFTAAASGNGQGSILNEDYSLNSPSLPAARGRTVMIYATGGGAMTPTPADGQVAAAPLAAIAQTVAAHIGGVAAPVSYAGAAPGLVNGVIQINVTVPDTIEPGRAAPIDLTIGGVTSPAGVTIAVR